MAASSISKGISPKGARLSSLVERAHKSLAWRHGHSGKREIEISFNSKCISISLHPDRIESTGFQIWDCAFLLLSYMEAHKDIFDGKRIIEVGSGHGLIGIAASLLLASEVIASDLPLLIPLIENNIKSNHSNAKAAPLEWGNEAHIEILNPPFDIILASDCVYARCFPMKELIDTFKSLSNPNSLILLSYEYRDNEAIKFFEMLKKDFIVNEIDQQEQDSLNIVCDDIKLYIIKKK